MIRTLPIRSALPVVMAGLVWAIAAGCQREPANDAAPGATADASPPVAADQGGEWKTLFDGRTLTGWRGFREKSPPAGWQVVDSALTRVASGGDIITNDQFADFELELEWKLQDGGNSGIFYRASEDVPRIYESAPEMQVLDDTKHVDGKSPLTSAGAAYGLYPPPAGHLRPVGEWNAVRLIVRGPHVEHWLNGAKVVEYELWSADWTAKVKASKFAEWPMYGLAKTGHIGLQDHGDPVAFRNIRIRELK